MNMSTLVAGKERVSWILSGQLSDDQPVRHLPVDACPFLVGRQTEASLSIPSPTVSRRHAELDVVDGQLMLRDLGSTNGTSVNGIRIAEPCAVHHGDLLQFGQIVFRVTKQRRESILQTIQDDSCDRALALIQFDQLVTERAVVPHFQPIVDMYDGRVFGYEVLGRSRLFGLKDPRSMFAAAKVLNMEGELSRILREEGVRHGQVLGGEHLLFVNTHPAELEDIDLLVYSLHELRGLEPNRRMVLEIHEAAVTSCAAMRQLRAALVDLKMGLAYDDFGAGQARLIELVEVRPDYLKFDMKLVQHLETAPPERQKMLASLVQMVRDLKIRPLAEGIETIGGHEICRRIGFDCAQGFLYGHPALPKTLLQQPRQHLAATAAKINAAANAALSSSRIAGRPPGNDPRN
jgi:EAL domain-containing protein (putative c-di-GMP-specific phosphodiesterase class I)